MIKLLKNILLLLAVLGLSSCMRIPAYRDSLDVDEKTITFINEHAINKEDAFTKAHEWIAKNYNSANDVIQMQDKAAGIIVVKARYDFVQDFGTITAPAHIRYTLSVYVKDKKIKTEFSTGLMKISGGEYTAYPPKENMPALLSHYQKINDEIIMNISSKTSDF